MSSANRPFRLGADADFVAVLALIRAAFAPMDGRVDPPSSAALLTAASIAAQATSGEVWQIGTPPCAVIFLTPKPRALYIGKLAVAGPERGQGHARALIEVAEARARAAGLAVLELQVRVELVENHAVFRALGFAVTAETAHPGYARPTSLTFTRPVPPPPRQALGSR